MDNRKIDEYSNGCKKITKLNWVSSTNPMLGDQQSILNSSSAYLTTQLNISNSIELHQVENSDSDDMCSLSQSTVRKLKRSSKNHKAEKKSSPTSQQTDSIWLDDSDVNSSNEITDEFDSDLSDIDEDFLDAYEYITDDRTGIHLFNGVLLDTKDMIRQNIELYSSMNTEILFEPLASSTLTAKGLLRNIGFQYDSIISKMTLPQNGKIIKIGCNQEEIYIYPNNYVDYNIIHIVEIIKNSQNSKYKTRVECNCQNLLSHADLILSSYEPIHLNINILKKTDIIRKIEKYLLTLKNRNKVLLDKIVKIFKRIVGFVFHIYLYDDANIAGIHSLLNQLEHNPEFERDDNIKIMKTLFLHVAELVSFFKEYIGRCTCIKQPYDPSTKIPVKIVSRDIKKKTSIKKVVPKHKTTIRKTQGCGKYFSSQITFEIYGEYSNKIYKIKIFNNGNFQAPGIKQSEMRDIIGPLTILVDYLRIQFGNDIYVAYIISVMRNYLSNVVSAPYISQIKDHNGRNKIFTTHLYLDKLYKILRQEKSAEYIMPKNALGVFNELVAKVGRDIAVLIFDYSNITTLKIAGIINNSEKSSGLIIKFDRSIPEKPNKKMTVKIYSIGKINFDGCNSGIEAYELYYWLNNLFRRHKDEIMFDSSKFKYYISDDDGEYESIYDDN
jgi:hypothetical protein